MTTVVNTEWKETLDGKCTGVVLNFLDLKKKDVGWTTLNTVAKLSHNSTCCLRYLRKAIINLRK